MKPPSRMPVWTWLVPALISLAAYLWTIAPTLTGEDSGELAAAAWTLGIPHPPGYPLWCLVTRAFMLVPAGDVAFRGNLASAIEAAAAVAFVALIAGRLGAAPVVAAAAGLLFGVSRTLWSQAVITEVYSLATLAIAVVVWCLLVWRDSGDARWLYAAAFLAALSSGAHHTVVLLVPVVAVFVWQGPRGWKPWPVIGALLAGGAIYAYLPLRARAAPPMNWGNPDTLERFWAHVMRAQYAGSPLHGSGDLPGQMTALVGFYLAQWPLAISMTVLLLALVGAWSLGRRGVLVTGAALMLSVAYVPVLNFPLDAEGLHVAEVFFAPAWMCVVLLAVAAVPRRWSTPAAGVLALAAAASLAVTLPQVTMRGNTVARVFAEDVLATVGQNALLVTSADYETFPVRYLQIVEGARPDVLLLDEQRDVEKGLAALGMQGLGADDPLSTLATQQARPVYFTRRLAVNGATLRPVGVLLRAWRGDRGAAEARRLDAEAWGRYRPLPQGPWLTADWSTASIAARYEEGRARSALARGDLLAARACVARAAAFLASDATHQNSLGALLAGGGDFAGAQPYYQRAIALRPKYPEAHYNAITAYINGGDVPSAQAAYARSQQAGVSLGEAGQRLEAFFMQAGGR